MIQPAVGRLQSVVVAGGLTFVSKNEGVKINYAIPLYIVDVISVNKQV